MDFLKKSSQDHEKLFDEICNKLNELSPKPPVPKNNIFDTTNDRLEKMQNHLRKSQEELKASHQEIQDKIQALQSMSFAHTDLQNTSQKIAEQLEAERINNSKLSSDLARSLELNLKLQFEIEEVRARSAQILHEEKKHNQFLTDKNKSLNHEVELSQALCNDMRLELLKAKEKFQAEASSWQNEKSDLEAKIQEHMLAVDEREVEIRQLQKLVASKDETIAALNGSLNELQDYTDQQQTLVQNLTEVAEKKLVELKIALDKKAAECQDYSSHLQQALTQINILRQENSALKEYISKMATLNQQVRPTEVRA